MQLAESEISEKKPLTNAPGWATIVPVTAKALKGTPSAPFLLIGCAGPNRPDYT